MRTIKALREFLASRKATIEPSKEGYDVAQLHPAEIQNRSTAVAVALGSLTVVQVMRILRARRSNGAIVVDSNGVATKKDDQAA